MSLTLNLAKPGVPVPKLELNLKKPAKFVVELFWDSVHDLDVHALLAANNGQGAKIGSLEQVLSYATKNNGICPVHQDGSFRTPCGSLRHSGDCRDGKLAGVDETITVDGSLIPPGMNEIPIFVTIYEQAPSGTTFAAVKDAGIRIKDNSGKVLGEYRLSTEFTGFNAVQMGSLMLSNNGWEYAAVGAGFNGDLNAIIANFS